MNWQQEDIQDLGDNLLIEADAPPKIRVEDHVGLRIDHRTNETRAVYRFLFSNGHSLDVTLFPGEHNSIDMISFTDSLSRMRTGGYIMLTNELKRVEALGINEDNPLAKLRPQNRDNVKRVRRLG